MFCPRPRARTHTHDCAFQFRQWCGAEETASLSERRREWESSGEKEEIKKKKGRKKVGETSAVFGWLWVHGDWRVKEVGGGEIEWSGREVGKGDWSVACPCASSTPLLSVFFFSLLSVVSGSLPRPPQTSPWAAARRTVLSFSRRQPQTELPCPLDINQHAFLQAPSTHTHTLTHTHSPVSSSDGQVVRRPSLTPALTCKWDVHERQTRDRKSFITHNFVFIKGCHVTNGGRKRSIHVPILLATFLLPLEVSRLTMWTFSICQCWMFSIYHWLNTKSVITGKWRLINIFK